MRELNSTQTAQATIGAASAPPAPRTWTAGLVGAAFGVGIGALLGLAVATAAMPAPGDGRLSESAGAAGLAGQVPITDQVHRHVVRENGGTAASAGSAGSAGDALRGHLLRENGGS